MLRFLARKRKGLAIEIIWFIAVLFFIGIVYVAFTPVISGILSFAADYDVNPQIINLLNMAWNNLPLIVIIAGIFFVVASAIWRQAEYYAV